LSIRLDAVRSRKHRTASLSALADTRLLGHTVAMTEKPFAPACERNSDPILAVLRDRFADRRHVLEIGSGTGQHAVHFAAALPGLVWQTSDRAENLAGIGAWLAEAALPNTPPPIELDVAERDWPATRFDAIFSANTLHIMSWNEVEALFAALPSLTAADAKLAIYGPFNYGGRYTSASNAAFDESLRSRAAHMGIRDMEAVDRLAQAAGFVLLDDVAMPANNRTLVWQRKA
jgi:cyclopropane fatty-acyl-phospholipid synthase-like methyltransferase